MGTHHTDVLLRFVRRWFDERTVTNTFEPLLADHQREWLDAPPASRVRIAMRTATAFLIALLTMAPRALLLTPTPAPMTRRILARMIVFVIAYSSLNMIPFLTELRAMPAGRLGWLALWLLPSVALVALPFAMGFAVDGVRRHSTPTAAERLTMLRAAIVAVITVVILHGWIVPATNQQFRLEASGNRTPGPAPGARELTTPQLIGAPWLARAEGHRRPVAIQRELHNRATFALLPLVLIGMRWRALNRPSASWRLPAWLSGILTIGVWGFLRGNDANIEALLGLGPGYGAWVPLAVFLALGWLAGRAPERTPTSILHA